MKTATTAKEKKALSPQKIAAIAAATAASKLIHNGKSPRKTGAERTEKALLWIYKWHWTTTSLLEIAVGGSGKSGLAARLIKAGLVVKTMTAGRGIDGSTSHFLTLSRTGLEHATGLSSQEIPYKLDPSRISQKQMYHDETVQRLTAVKLTTMIHGERITDFRTEKQLRVGFGKSEKIPDAMWRVSYADERKPSRKIAIELELSSKWGQELDTFVYQTLEQLREKKCDCIEIFAESPKLLARYRAAFAVGSKLQTWSHKTGVWVKASSVVIPPRGEDVVRFHLITPLDIGGAAVKKAEISTDSTMDAKEKPKYEIDGDFDFDEEDFLAYEDALDPDGYQVK